MIQFQLFSSPRFKCSKKKSSWSGQCQCYVVVEQAQNTGFPTPHLGYISNLYLFSTNVTRFVMTKQLHSGFVYLGDAFPPVNFKNS